MTLQEALSNLIQTEQLEQDPEFRLSLMVHEPLELDPIQIDQVVHIAREAMLNACKHAKANSVTVSFSATSTTYELTIEDDGQGFSPEATIGAQDTHFGLSIMQARAKRMGGDLAICTGQGAGTEVVLTWPKSDRVIATEQSNGTRPSHLSRAEQLELNEAAPWPN
jgi:two-component system nitrate/nitrite sensor histidine kinase NarX